MKLVLTLLAHCLAQLDNSLSIGESIVETKVTGKQVENCKVDCLDLNKTYCANDDFEYTGGYCCTEEEQCPKTPSCSKNIISKYAKQLVCPNDALCGARDIIVRKQAYTRFVTLGFGHNV